ncbi:response regulator [Sandaracinus amylolyticus]|nr:response regulator [Sandaracinus amylolyticus]
MTSERAHTVLVVDDEIEILESLRRTLRGESYRLVTTTSPHEALESVRAGEVDVVISDIDMPEMSGIELVAEIRRVAPDVVRVLLTGDASLPSALSAINEGEVHRYLTKPWDKHELRAMLRQALERLDELRRIAEADRRSRERSEMLDELEREHPGIREVVRVDGAYAIDAERLWARMPLELSTLPGASVRSARDVDAADASDRVTRRAKR